MTKKQTTFLIFAAVILVGIFYLLPWFQYSKAIDKRTDDWYTNSYIKKSFSGRIKSISNYDSNPNKIVLLIDDGKEFDITYGVTCVDKDFIEFVKQGDSVYKVAGSKYITFAKSHGQRKDIELNFCDKFK
jgi:archaellum component FlaF (FlaF/FlaG flagellin family)